MEKKDIDKILIKKILILFIAIVGFITTIKLSIIYYDSNFNPYALPSFCSVNDFVDCDGVAQTTHSQFLGIPLSYWGMLLYLFIIFLLVVDKLKEIKLLKFLEVFKNPLCYISALGFISFAISILLAFVSFFQIKKICVLCLFTYFLNLLIAAVATDFKAGIINVFKISIKDFIDALRVKKYLISFLIISLLAGCVLTYTSLSYCFTPQVKRYKELTQYIDMKENPFKITGNTLGDENAKLIVYIYTDYCCPICRTYNLMIHRAAKELGGLKIIHKNLPLDIDCNKNLNKQFHKGACTMAKYSIAAEKQGHFWDFNTELFENQPKSEHKILKLAKEMGLDTIKLREDANDPKTEEKVQNEIEEAINMGIDGTPTIVINEKIYSGIKPYYELKELLIKAGAFEKK